MRRPARQRGAVAVAFLLLTIVLLGFVGLAVDVARLYVSKSELQNAADACALAAASALTAGNPQQLRVAEWYGLTLAARHNIGMQKISVSAQQDSTLQFSDAIDGVYRPKNQIATSAVLDMRFARCTLTESAVPLVLLQVVRGMGDTVNPATVRASATAGLAPSRGGCALPLAICRKTGSTAPAFGYTTGEWLTGRFQPGSALRGKFKWVQFPGFERTSDLADLVAKGGQCNLSGSQAITPANGVINSLVDVWNWRFGVKKNSGAPAGAYPPDFTGYAYDATNWRSQSNAYNDFLTRRSANTPWNNQPALGGSWSASTAAVHAAGQDRRMAVLPVVDCANWDSGGSASTVLLGWACVLMLNPVSTPSSNMALEYRGPAGTAGSGCFSAGAPGGPSATGPRVPALVM